MFLLKQIIKALILPPVSWIILLILVAVFWPRRWARRLLIAVIVLVSLLHNGLVNNYLRLPLEAVYPILVDPREVEPYDAIVVLLAKVYFPTPLTPFPTIGENMFQRLDEATRLYRIRPMPIIVSGNHGNIPTALNNDNKIAREYLIRWGVPEDHVIPEANSRDTFEGALEVQKILQAKGWRRYLLVTSSIHMPRSMMAFGALAPEPIAAPGDFTVRDVRLTITVPRLYPSEDAAEQVVAALYEYAGLLYYSWRLRHREAG
jgi:uncharacterized SAM-binding protein YcdF (DUF218 family)